MLTARVSRSLQAGVCPRSGHLPSNCQCRRRPTTLTQIFPQSQAVEALVAQAHYNLQVGRPPST